MTRNQRSTHRQLPGLFQALSWLRQNLPPAERPPLVLVPVLVPTRLTRRRRAVDFADHGHPHRSRRD